LRDEEKFSDLDALVDQMHRDAAQARDVLAATPLHHGAAA
jgi:riboflavin kinase/FMN adenylyltransferase